MINLLTNEDYDRFMPLLRLPVIKQLIYNNSLYKAKFGIIAPKALSAFKKRNHMPL